MSTHGEDPIRPRRISPDEDDAAPADQGRPPRLAHAAGVDAASDADAAHTGAHPFTQSVLWTIIGTIIPGLGLWPTRFRKLGLGIVGLAIIVLAGTAWRIRGDLGGTAALAFRAHWLVAIAVGAIVLALLWIVLIIGTHLVTRPRHLTGTQRGLGAALVGVLSFIVSAPLAIGANYVLDQRSLVTTVFKSGDDTRSETRPTNVGTGSNPWKNKPRLNILLLGGDNSASRDKIDPNEGIRTDSMMLASIDTTNGNTTLIQLPRNTERAPFPKGSALAAAYPEGFWNPANTQDAEYELNAVWGNVPAAHPELFKNTDYPGGDALKEAVEGITGLKVDYFMLLNLDGFSTLIDAIGGVRVNVNVRTPVDLTSEAAARGLPPAGGWIDPGPNVLLDGYHALWYARSRAITSDYVRMANQSCLIKAVIDQVSPETMLTRYESIADAGKKMVVTDIPSEVLPALVQLGLKVKDANIRRILFAYGGGFGNHDFKPWDPDFALMQQQIQQAIAETENTSPAATAASSSTAATKATSTPSTPATTPAASSAPASTASSDSNANSSDLTDVCAYHPGS